MKKIFELIKCDLKIFIREPMGAAFIIFFPIVMMVASFIVDSGGNYLIEMIAGTIGLAIMSSSIMGVAIVMGINRETNIYKRYHISNIKGYMIFLSIFIVHAFLTIISTLLQLSLVIVLYGIDKLINADLVGVIMDYLISIILLFSIGIFLSSVIKSLKNLHGITSLIFTIMMLLCGSTFPISKMPNYMQKIVMLLPLSHINSILYHDLIGGNVHKGIFYIYAMVVTAICFGIGIRHFKWEVE